MKKILTISSVALLALSACDQPYGEQSAANASPDQYAGKSCSELMTLREEYKNVGEVMSTNDRANSVEAVAGAATAVAGAPVVGATMMAGAIGQDQSEQQVRTGGQAQYAAIVEAGQKKGCW